MKKFGLNGLMFACLVLGSGLNLGGVATASETEIKTPGCEFSRVGCRDFPGSVNLVSIIGQEAEELYAKLPAVGLPTPGDVGRFEFSTHGAEASFGKKTIQIKCVERILRVAVTTCKIIEVVNPAVKLPELTPFQLTVLLAKAPTKPSDGSNGVDDVSDLENVEVGQ